jgi:hypothetical protein
MAKTPPERLAATDPALLALPSLRFFSDTDVRPAVSRRALLPGGARNTKEKLHWPVIAVSLRLTLARGCKALRAKNGKLLKYKKIEILKSCHRIRIGHSF